MTVHESSALDALLTLTNAISGATRLEAIYEAALDCLAQALDVRRSSILLFDPDGVMRFKAARNLSPAYQRAVEGHTPWTPHTRDAQPIVVTDVRSDADLAAYLPLIQAEGIRAMTFVPLSTDTGVIGKFMLYYPERHGQAADELKTACVIAAQVAFAVQRAQAEAATRAHERELRLVTDAAPVLLTHCGADRRYRFVNKAYAARFGLTPQDIVGRTIREVLGDAASASLERYVDAALRGEAVQFELDVPYDRLGPRVMRVEYVPEVTASGAVAGFVGVIVDVTERRRAEEALRESEASFRQLADALPTIVWTARGDGTPEYYNRRWHEYSGLAAAGPSAGATIVHPDDAASNSAAWAGSVASGAPYQMEVRLMQHATRTYRWHLARAVPVCDDAGRVVRWVGSSTDIDDQKRSAAALQEADRQKDEFLAVLAHELRNPLAPIRTALKLMQLPGDDAARRERACAVMDRQVLQLVRLVDDLLDVSRITRGKIELQTDRLELAGVIHDAIETSRPAIEAAGHELAVTFPPERIYVDGDATRLSQLFANLLNNAAKYTARAGHISLAVERRGRDAVVRVKDSGIGIPADMLPRVFDMFTQVDRSLEKTHGGLGIGLTLVKRLAEMHGGSVEARSAGAGKGSEFIVSLPIHELSATDDGPSLLAASQIPSSVPARRVLVVDDNEDAAECLAEMLRLQGHDVRTAHDGLDAIDVAKVFGPDVVLLDLGMPRLNGYDASPRIREHLGPGAFIIAVTGWGQPDDRRRAREAGFDRHLIKPVDPAELDAVLASLPVTPR